MITISSLFEENYFTQRRKEHKKKLTAVVNLPLPGGANLKTRQLFGFVNKDIKDTLKVMKGYPVTIRLLDPPLQEFVPHDTARMYQLSRELGISIGVLKRRVLALHGAGHLYSE